MHVLDKIRVFRNKFRNFVAIMTPTPNLVPNTVIIWFKRLKQIWAACYRLVLRAFLDSRIGWCSRCEPIELPVFLRPYVGQKARKNPAKEATIPRKREFL